MSFARLGLESAQIPHVDRHGMLWLERGNLFVKDGTLRFVSAGGGSLEKGTYDIPYQNVSMIVLEPGTTITHDVFRLMGQQGTGLIAVGDKGVRCYTAPPLGPDRSALARRQVELWANPQTRLQVALAMYAIRFGEELPTRKIEDLRGIEGARLRKSYSILAKFYGLTWTLQRFNRKQPNKTDDINAAVNHAASAMYGAADIAVAAVSAIPQLGFIHAKSCRAFALDIADLYRTEITLPAAFRGLASYLEEPGMDLERHVRKLIGQELYRQKVISKMIDQIKELILHGQSDEELEEKSPCWY